MAVVVTIGRNVDSEPMSEQDWLDFQDAVRHSFFEAYNPQVYFAGTGEGLSDTWGREEAWTIIAEEPQYSDFREVLLLKLERVRRAYGQEAVAVTEGRTSFV